MGQGGVGAGRWLWGWLHWAEGAVCGESWAARASRGAGRRAQSNGGAAREQAGVGGSSAGVAKRAGRTSLALRERVLGRAWGEAGLRGERGRVEFWLWVGLGLLSISLFLFLFTLSLIKSNSNNG